MTRDRDIPENVTPRRPRAPRGEARTLIARHYPAIAFDLLRPLVEVLTLSRRQCGGDLERFLVLMVVAIRTAEHPCFRSASQLQLLNSDEPLLPTLGTNIRSVAASAGIPRETVRRKVGELIDVGWLAWNGRSLCITAKAYRDLTPVREAVQRAAAGHFETVNRLVARSDDPVETE